MNWKVVLAVVVALVIYDQFAKGLFGNLLGGLTQSGTK